MVKIGNLKVGKGAPLFLIAGPCVKGLMLLLYADRGINSL